MKFRCINWWNSGALIKTQNKETRRWIPAPLLAPIAASLITPVALLLKEIFGKGITRAGRVYNNMAHICKGLY